MAVVDHALPPSVVAATLAGDAREAGRSHGREPHPRGGRELRQPRPPAPPAQAAGAAGRACRRGRAWPRATGAAPGHAPLRAAPGREPPGRRVAARRHGRAPGGRPRTQAGGRAVRLAARRRREPADRAPAAPAEGRAAMAARWAARARAPGLADGCHAP